MIEPTLLLEGAFVVTLDQRGTAGALSVAVRGGRILKVGQPHDLRGRFGAAARVDLSDRLLMPGLVNAHLHPELQVLRGALEERDLHAWDAAPLLGPALAYLGSDEGRWIQRAATRAALAEALLSGTTTVGTYGVTAGSEQTCRAAIVELGMRGTVTIRDRSFAPVADAAIPYMYRLHAEEELDEAELAAAATAHARGERLVMHCAETVHRRALAQARFGCGSVMLLERFGLLSPRLLLSHAIHTDPAERALLAERRVAIVSSPIAEMKLGEGVAPITSYLDAGLTVALGTDAAVCNNGTDLFLEMRALGLTQKLVGGATTLPASLVLHAATAAGARALGLGEDSGAVAPGQRADLVVLGLDSPRLRPLLHGTQFSNVAANLVYAATGQDVTDVMVGGRWAVRERRLRAADQDALWAELQEAATALFDRLGRGRLPVARQIRERADTI
ncbi:MAG: amidohydrolase family protein [Longimicrobiales bacterium]